MEANDQIHRRAQEALRRARPLEALRLYRQLLQNTHVIDHEYDEWLGGAVEAYRQLGRSEEAAYGLVYLQRFAEARTLFAAVPAPLEVARCRELEARQLSVGPTAELFLEAARGYAAAGRHVLAALNYAAAGAGGQREARHSWERVLEDPRLRQHPYEQALCHFNLSLAARRVEDFSACNRHLVQAQRLLEEQADEFEARGERERAFDCYGVLLQIGRESGSFENVAEGYINCIRVLKADNLKYYVLQYYEDFLRIALEREEFHAAALVLREAADYARRLGLIYDRHYLKRAAEAWCKAAQKNERDGGPAELTENAYLAAIDSFNSIGDFPHVRETYLRLAALALPDKKRQRYARVAERYADASEEPVEAAGFPDYLRHQQAYPATWEQDLVEWELDGDPMAVCSFILGDAHYMNLSRRRALNVLLLHLESRSSAEEPSLLAQIAQTLGELQVYAVLRPLERLYEHPHLQVRRGVMKTLRNLYFKRTFHLIQRGLEDESREVREGALEAVSALHFPAAFDCLSRIFQESEDLRVRQTALESIGRITTVEAGEFLLEVMRHEPALADVAQRLLANCDVPEIFPILRRQMELETGPARAKIEQVLRGAGRYAEMR
ncbi:MAG TPA: HEAT repeat domain-containing protein [Polyangia bacterium]|jgi:hypothetical protein|nr:HEAT repeat domain-containing protein [Polyangia bacterium]